MNLPSVSVKVSGNYTVDVEVGDGLPPIDPKFAADFLQTWPISPASILADAQPIYRLPDDWVCRPCTVPLSEVYDWSLEYTGIPKLWAETRGEGLKICVLDTGVDDTHPDLLANLQMARDFTGSLNGAKDVVSHGTWCAGLLCAEASNNYGVAGICNKAALYCGKVLGDNGAGNDQTIEAGLRWAMSLDCDIVSMSLGGGRMSDRLHRVFQEFTSRPGKFIFAAAGNDGRSVNYPGAWPETIGVGAVDRNGRLTRFTSRGPELDILFPGVDMLSTIPVHMGSFATMSGTSMACPGVAGVGALALAKHKKLGGKSDLLTTADMRAHMKKASTDKGDGYGLLDPGKLLAEAHTGPVAPTPGGGLKIGPLRINSPAVVGDLFSIGLDA